MTFPQCTELVATTDFTTFEGRSMRRFVKGQTLWVTNSEESQKRLGTLALARKGQNAAMAQYFTLADVAAYLTEATR